MHIAILSDFISSVLGMYQEKGLARKAIALVITGEKLNHYQVYTTGLRRTGYGQVSMKA